MIKAINIITILCLAAVTGCAAKQPQRQTMMPVTMPSVNAVAFERDINKRDPESLAGIFSEEVSRDFYQDLRAYKVGDLVTINIVETSNASKSASTQTGRNSSIDAGIQNMLGWEGKIKNLTSFGNSDARNAFNSSSMLKGSLTNSFNGSGQTSRGDSMTASITAKVIDVKPNGNLLIEGIREIRVNSETQIIILSGFIRPVDISPDNTVLSSYIGEAKIEYLGTGAISDKQRPGWLTRAADIVWPF
ncbi:MAG: flagellar basal body L-ring protein FlgH [Deltaproteobacteria bacterium]|nr:flagellar basal body L-ring protein FlgH [Deltaproteobacteria bacterium]